jgi:hypothetical protein
MDVHEVTVHFHLFARRGELLTSPREGDALVGTTSCKEKSEDENDPQDDAENP